MGWNSVERNRSPSKCPCNPANFLWDPPLQSFDQLYFFVVDGIQPSFENFKRSTINHFVTQITYQISFFPLRKYTIFAQKIISCYFVLIPFEQIQASDGSLKQNPGY